MLPCRRAHCLAGTFGTSRLQTDYGHCIGVKHPALSNGLLCADGSDDGHYDTVVVNFTCDVRRLEPSNIRRFISRGNFYKHHKIELVCHAIRINPLRV